MNLKDIHKQIMSELGTGPEYKGSNGLTVPSVVAKEEAAKEVGKTSGKLDSRSMMGWFYEGAMKDLQDNYTPEELISILGSIPDAQNIVGLKKTMGEMREKKTTQANEFRKLQRLINLSSDIPLGSNKTMFSSQLQGIKNYIDDVIGTQVGDKVEDYESLKGGAGLAATKEAQGGKPSDIDLKMMMTMFPEVSGLGADSRELASSKLIPLLINAQLKYPQYNIVSDKVKTMPGYQDILDSMSNTIPKNMIDKLRLQGIQ